MYRQWEKLADHESITAAITYPKDLKYTTGQLAGLVFVFEASTVSGAFAGGGKWRIIDYIDNIQIMLNGNPNGGALNARAAQAIGSYRIGQRPISAWRVYGTNNQRDFVVWPFGTNLWDTRRYLDLSRYSSTAIRIQNSFTSSLFTGMTVSIYGLWLRENNVGTQGYIRREMVREYVPVAGSTDQNILPIDYPICGVYVQGDPGLDGNGRVNTHPHNLVYPVRFSLRDRQVDLFNDNISVLNYISNQIWGEEPTTQGQLYINSGKEVNVGLAHVIAMNMGASTKTGAAATVIPTVEADENNPSQNVLSYAGDQIDVFIARGTGYENVFPLHMDISDDLSQMIDPKANGSVTVDITTRSGVTVTNAFNRIYLERLAPV